MNSKLIASSFMLALMSTMENCNAIHIGSEQTGIFSTMIEQAVGPEERAKEREEAKMRKQKQLDDAEKDYQSMVQQEEREEAAKLKKEQEEADR